MLIDFCSSIRCSEKHAEQCLYFPGRPARRLAFRRLPPGGRVSRLAGDRGKTKKSADVPGARTSPFEPRLIGEILAAPPHGRPASSPCSVHNEDRSIYS